MKVFVAATTSARHGVSDGSEAPMAAKRPTTPPSRMAGAVIMPSRSPAAYNARSEVLPTARMASGLTLTWT